jgi:hypothetical protein
MIFCSVVMAVSLTLPRSGQCPSNHGKIPATSLTMSDQVHTFTNHAPASSLIATCSAFLAKIVGIRNHQYRRCPLNVARCPFLTKQQISVAHEPTEGIDFCLCIRTHMHAGKRRLHRSESFRRPAVAMGSRNLHTCGNEISPGGLPAAGVDHHYCTHCRVHQTRDHSNNFPKAASPHGVNLTARVLSTRRTQ